MGGCLAKCMGGAPDHGLDLDRPAGQAKAPADAAAPPPPPSATDEADNEHAAHALPDPPAPPAAHIAPALVASTRDVQLLVEMGERGQDAADEAAPRPHAAAAAGLCAAQRRDGEARDAETVAAQPHTPGPPAPAAQAPSSRQAPAERPRPASLPAGSLAASHLRWGAADKVLHTNILAWGEHDRQRTCGTGGLEIKMENLPVDNVVAALAPPTLPPQRGGSAGAAQDPEPPSAVHQAAAAAGAAADTTEGQEGSSAGEDEPEFVRLLRQDAAQVLDLSSQSLGDDEALSIASALLSNTSLVSLDLSANDVAGGLMAISVFVFLGTPALTHARPNNTRARTQAGSHGCAHAQTQGQVRWAMRCAAIQPCLRSTCASMPLPTLVRMRAGAYTHARTHARTDTRTH